MNSIVTAGSTQLNEINSGTEEMFQVFECSNATIDMLPNVVDQSTLLSRREKVKKLSTSDKQKLMTRIYDSKETSNMNMGPLYILQRTLKEKNYPTYKFVDPRRDKFRRPDFTDEQGMRGGDLTLVMANKIFNAMNMISCSEEEKASFWKTYSGRISRWFSLNRCANTKAMKRSFEAGKLVFYLILFITVVMI